MTHLLDDTSLSKPAGDAGLLDTITIILRIENEKLHTTEEHYFIAAKKIENRL